MLTNNLKQLLGITLKNLFDIDIAVLINLFLVILTIFALAKMYLRDALNLVSGVWAAIQLYTREFRLSIAQAKDHLENTDLKETLINTYRTVKHNLTDKRYSA